MAGSIVPEDKELNTDLKSLRKLWPYLWPKNQAPIKWRFILAILALFASKAATLAVPLLFKEIIDHLNLTTTSTLALIPLSLIFAYGLARLLSAAFNEIRDGIFAVVTQKAVRHVGLQVFRHVHALSLRFHLDRQTGGLSRIIERGTKGIENLLQFLTFNIVPTLVEIVLVCLLLWTIYEIPFALITLVTLISYIGFTLIVTEWRISFVKTMNSKDNEATTKAVDSLLNYETVKYFNNEAHEAKRFDHALVGYQNAAIKSKLSLSFLNIGQALIITVGLVLVMWLAMNRIQTNTMTVGDFVALNTYLMQLYMPLFMLGFAYREVKISLVNMDSMFTLLDVPSEIKDKANAPNLRFKKGEIKFEDVSFAYNSDRPILEKLSFTIPAGKTLAIVGASGAGKSTISRLLFRFYDATTGRILIDGQDIRDVTQDSLRRLIGIVPQDTVLFNDTILYNIAYGNPEASKEDSIQAAKSAHIYKFISSLPEGFDARVGERGLKLSGGEKQRIAIARTILKKPKIFLFDEATSALDTHTEKAIQRSLNSLSKDHTTLIIAHRLSTVIDADEIIVLDQGTIVERGTHQQLLTIQGTYYEMWQRQQQSYQDEAP